MARPDALAARARDLRGLRRGLALSALGDPYTDKINAMPKYVASRTLTEATWNATILEGDAAEAVAALKRATRRGTS